jgi:SSS family solute:Na+ symporter
MAVLSVAYVWQGGFGAVVRTEFLQFALMFAGFAGMLGILVAGHGGIGFLSARVPESHWTWDGGMPVQSIVVWYFIASSTLVEPTFYQHCFAAATPSVARRGLALSILCWLCFDALTTFTGLYARAILDLAGAPATEAFPRLAMGVLPPGLVGVFFIAMLATVMSTVDGYLFVAASTFGRDLLGRTARYRDRLPAATRIGLLLAGAATLAIALVSSSVVRLWHHLGTISTATLLFPVLAAFRPRWLLPPRTTLAQMATVLAVTSASLASRLLTDDGGYALGVEPIYAGLGTGAAFYAWHHAGRALRR